MRFYRVAEVPQLDLPLPQGVTQVEFVADLGSSKPMSMGEVRAEGGVVAAAIPASAAP